MTDAHTHHSVPSGVVGIQNVRFGVDEKTIIDILYSVGIHPWDAHKNVDWNSFEQLARQSVAIGECGLDKNSRATITEQLQVFEYQTQLATQIGKPVIVHCVRAYGYLLQASIKQKGHSPWLVHGCYASTEWIAEATKQEFYFSVGPKQLKMPRISEILQAIPPNKLLLETDDSGEDIKKVYAILNVDEQRIDDNFNCFFCL